VVKREEQRQRRGMPDGETRRARVDAERNRERLLVAARDVFVEQGPEAPLDEIARRAGVGIATLYRRFPDRQALMQAVVMDALASVAEAASRALAEEPNGFAALGRYMHAALDLRIAAVIPALLGQVALEDPAVTQLRDLGVGTLETIIDTALREGMLRADVAFADIGLLINRLSRPLPGAFPRELDIRLAHRHLEIVLDGLRMARESTAAPLPGPVLTLDNLRTFGPADPPLRATSEERGSHDPKGASS
jgi:AcrR family transcriptional regulator